MAHGMRKARPQATDRRQITRARAFIPARQLARPLRPVCLAAPEVRCVRRRRGADQAPWKPRLPVAHVRAQAAFMCFWPRRGAARRAAGRTARQHDAAPGRAARQACACLTLLLLRNPAHNCRRLSAAHAAGSARAPRWTISCLPQQRAATWPQPARRWTAAPTSSARKMTRCASTATAPLQRRCACVVACAFAAGGAGRLSRTSYVTQNGKTPLALAAGEGHAAVVRLLLERGADKKARSKVRAHAQRLRRLGARRWAKGWRGRAFPVSRPRTRWHRISSLRLRLRAWHRVSCGAAQDHYTPLHHGAVQGDLECVRLLLQHGAEKEAIGMVRSSLAVSRLAPESVLRAARRVAIHRCTIQRTGASSSACGCCWIKVWTRMPKTGCAPTRHRCCARRCVRRHARCPVYGAACASLQRAHHASVKGRCASDGLASGRWPVLHVYLVGLRLRARGAARR